MYDFLTDLDEYFCEKYANYDKLCVLPGYKMPIMQATRLDEYGRTYAYTLPLDNMRLAKQENKGEILAELKKRLTDLTFSLGFTPLSFFRRIKNKCSKNEFYKFFMQILKKYGLTEETARENLTVDEEVWKKICKGDFYPSKNLLFSFALAAHISMEDVRFLLLKIGEQMDYAVPKDVVVAYLLENKVYDEGMIAAAFAEYKIKNLYLA